MPEYFASPKSQNWNFLVRVPGVGSANFRTVRGMKMGVEVINFREGGDNHSDKKYPARATFDNLTLERGKMERNSQLAELFRQVYDISTNIGNEPRFTMFVELKNRQQTTISLDKFIRCLCISYEKDDYDASGNDILIERIELAIEGWEVIF
jgi:phage tail-like protein